MIGNNVYGGTGGGSDIGDMPYKEGISYLFDNTSVADISNGNWTNQISGNENMTTVGAVVDSDGNVIFDGSSSYGYFVQNNSISTIYTICKYEETPNVNSLYWGITYRGTSSSSAINIDIDASIEEKTLAFKNRGTLYDSDYTFNKYLVLALVVEASSFKTFFNGALFSKVVCDSDTLSNFGVHTASYTGGIPSSADGGKITVKYISMFNNIAHTDDEVYANCLWLAQKYNVANF